MRLEDFTIKQIQKGLKSKEFSAAELTRAYFERIKSEDKKIGAYLSLLEDSALKQAEEVDAMIGKGKKLPDLAGVPMAVKDNILIENEKCTAGSKMLENYLAVYDATVIKKLKANKAIFLGKTNLDEFAMGSSTENSAFGLTRNPHNLERVAGGSSGGSAAAVASNQAVCALGSDTGGSIRQPASFCGVVGLKPTYGLVSRYGLIAFGSSLDQVGPITKNIEDAETVFNIIKGKDERDSTSVEPEERPGEKFRINNLRIGVPKEYFEEGIESGVKQIIEKAIEKVENQGMTVEEISLPHTKYAIACYYLIAPSEASANLARYDGIRYGLAQEGRPDKNLIEEYENIRAKGFGSEVKRRIMLGTYVLSAGYYEAYYLKAQRVRTLLKKDFEKAFQRVEAIFTPTTPSPAFKIGEKVDNPLEMYMSDVLTVSLNLAGLPGLSMPVGRVNGLPVGLQIIGRAFSEREIFKIGRVMENLLQ